MRADRFRQVLAVAAVAVAAAVLQGPASAHATGAPAGDRRQSSTLVATVDVAPASHLVEPRDETNGGRAKAVRGPLLLLAVLVALLEAARRGGASARLRDAGARHRSDRWTVSLRGPPATFS